MQIRLDSNESLAKGVPDAVSWDADCAKRTNVKPPDLPRPSLFHVVKS